MGKKGNRSSLYYFELRSQNVNKKIFFKGKWSDPTHLILKTGLHYILTCILTWYAENQQLVGDTIL